MNLALEPFNNFYKLCVIVLLFLALLAVIVPSILNKEKCIEYKRVCKNEKKFLPCQLKCDLKESHATLLSCVH